MTYNIRLSQADLVLNIINNDNTIILICPGGGYELLSNRESGPISVKFNCLGYNTAILYYNLAPMAPFTPFADGVEALEKLSEKFDNIIVMGFSAGGHLAGLLATKAYMYNIKASVLCYPVISLGEYTHEGTSKNFLGSLYNEENIFKYSIQNCVTKNTPPCFIWTTKTDELVPFKNTLMMIDALKENNIYYECVIYPEGPHGYALADETADVMDAPGRFLNKEVSNWPNLVDKFIKKILK